MHLFSFLYPHCLATCSDQRTRTSTTNIIKEYKNDFSDDLEFEIRSFATEFKSEIQEKHTVMDIIKVLQDSRVSSSLPQFYKLLVLFVTIPVTVAPTGRSFSKLKSMKTYLRSIYQCHKPVCLTWRLFQLKTKKQERLTGTIWLKNLLLLTLGEEVDSIFKSCPHSSIILLYCYIILFCLHREPKCRYM